MSVLFSGNTLNFNIGEMKGFTHCSQSCFRLIQRSPKASIKSIALFDLNGRSLAAEVSYNGYEPQVRTGYRGLVIVKVQTPQGIQVQRVVLE